MPRYLKEGDTINGYRIEKTMDPGAMSQPAIAKSPKGELVFFKQYKMPTVRSSWYKAYVEFEKEFKHRIDKSLAKD